MNIEERRTMDDSEQDDHDRDRCDGESSIDETADDRPFVSVIIPVYNDPDGLKATLEAVTTQSYPDERYEIVVVDNDSTDATPTVAAEYARRHPDLVRATAEREIQSSYAARNTGVKKSEGDVLAFIDADMTVEEEWLERSVAAIRERDAEYMAGDVELYHGEDEPTLASRYDRLSGFPIERYVTENRFGPTCSLFVDRKVFDDVGLFDERLISGGDVEFGHRVHGSGRTIHYAPSVTMYHPTRSSLRSLLGKYVRNGRGTAQRRRLYADYDGGWSALDPRLYLPPNPLRFKGKMGSEWRDLTRREKAGLYLIGHLERLARGYGQLRETVAAMLTDVDSTTRARGAFAQCVTCNRIYTATYDEDRLHATESSDCPRCGETERTILAE